MKKSNLFFYSACIAIFLTFSTNIYSQTTIGSGFKPKLGSLLDLKEEEDDGSGGSNSKRGLLLPRVSLDEVTTLAPDGATFSGDEVHIGLMVYNMTNTPRKSLCKGVYIWDGDKWDNLNGECPCEYTIIGHDGNEYYFNCDDIIDTQANAAQACANKISSNSSYRYHLLTTEEYAQVWDKPTTDGEFKFTDGEYHLNYFNWITFSSVISNKSNIQGVGFEFPGGSSIGLVSSGNKTIRCVRD